MSLIDKLLLTKDRIEDYIKKQGMEAAVQKYGLTKLLKSEVLAQYKGTELYYNDDCIVDRVYNNKGKFLGNITHLMSSYYKKMGRFFGPCLNGNIILSIIEHESSIRTYGVFDKFGNQIVEYGKYFSSCFLPNGVALINGSNGAETNAVTIHYDGTVKVQPFMYIEKIGAGPDFELKRIEEEKIKTYIIKESVINNMMSKSTEVGKEKGIE